MMRLLLVDFALRLLFLLAIYAVGEVCRRVVASNRVGKGVKPTKRLSTL